MVWGHRKWDWTGSFAWFPVKLWDGRHAWLCRVEKVSFRSNKAQSWWSFNVPFFFGEAYCARLPGECTD